MQNQKIFFYYHPDDCLELEVECGEENIKTKERHGFKHIYINEPYYYSHNSSAYIEIHLFYRNKDNTYIIEFYDPNHCVFYFACKSQVELFDLSLKFMQMADHMVSIESKIFNINKRCES